MKWFMGNHDGKRNGLVVASSQKKVAEVAGTTVYDVQRFWHVQHGDPPPGLKENTLYTRWNGLHLPKDEGWVEGYCGIPG